MVTPPVDVHARDPYLRNSISEILWTGLYIRTLVQISAIPNSPTNVHDC
jgi:hypothetical protein